MVVRLRQRRKKARGIVMDLGRGGIFVKTKAKVELGSELVVCFRARPDMRCEGRGRIARVLNTRMLLGFGIEFEQVNEPFEQLLSILERLDPQLRQQFLKETIERELVIL